MYPARFHKDESKEPGKDQFEREGRAFFDLCGGKGHYKMLRGTPFGKNGALKSVVHGRVVVDIRQYYEDEDNSAVRPTLMSSNNDVAYASDDEAEIILLQEQVVDAHIVTRIHCREKEETGQSSTTFA